MGYLHIDNLYKNQDILMFKECYALEKVHGTSAHIAWDEETGLRFFSGGAKHESFVSIFDAEDLSAKLKGCGKVVVYGEAYGGKLQGMSDVYGKELRFVAFDVKINERWLCVPQADQFVQDIGLEFVFYDKVSTDLEVLDAFRDAPSVQGFRNLGLEDGESEGVVLRPLIELTRNDGKRIIVKHKRESFRETATRRVVGQDPAVLANADAVATEWVTPMRLAHVLDKLQVSDIKDTPAVMAAMLEDVKREAGEEVVWSKPVERAISGATAKLYKHHVSTLFRTAA